MLDAINEAITSFIHSIGYLGIAILMALESTMVPIPSELVMPFAGFLASVAGGSHFSLVLVILMNTVGAMAGSLAFYWVGAKGGKPLLLKVGKVFLVKEEDIDKTERYFQKPGRLTVFIARLIPVVRHFISFVAGLGKMPLVPFSVQTALGATLWGGFLATLGYAFGDEYMTFVKTTKYIDWAVGGLIIVACVWLYLRWRKKRKAAAQAA
ncbi:MAG: DedA family protein [Myxococcota bacterium]